ncbi:DUF4935 domain-containing protein [Streptomyces sp. ISL-111]|uniref:PIN-like domain-containing protein n=1 Tax=Streptomyces sp. ISL-111 TaxID=2819175 RepID=UPI001BECD7C9|nr:PIN-like domain-containing protein [Streptomyces sp. ISL-111]MBT2381475.1 DUF4935 domain-containing protein [Streptomyces sp. ISL-111]
MDANEEVDSHDPSRERGIFDCDEAYRTPTRSDYERLFRTEMVVLDTNVLLTLYRSNQRTREDILSVLSRLKERLWIPDQVLVEFWRNRSLPSIRGHHRTKANEASASLDKSSRAIRDTLDRWTKEVHLSSDEGVQRKIDEARKILNDTLGRLKGFIQDQAEKDAIDGTAATHTDPILAELEILLRGRIGDPLTADDYSSAIQDAQQRADSDIPPGYADFRTKPAEQAAGDYILWKQIIDESIRRRQDVLLVTGDVKEDWWVKRDGEIPARPRKELELELRQRTGGSQLFMLTPSQLLSEANEVFGLKVDQRSVADLATSENAVDDLTSLLSGVFLRAHLRTREAMQEDISGAKNFYAPAFTECLLNELDRVESIRASVPLSGRRYPVIDGNVIIPIRCGSTEDAMDRAHTRVGTSAIAIKAMDYLIPQNGLGKPNSELSLWKQAGVSEVTVVPYVANRQEGVRIFRWGPLDRGKHGEVTWRARGKVEFVRTGRTMRQAVRRKNTSE